MQLLLPVERGEPLFQVYQTAGQFILSGRPRIYRLNFSPDRLKRPVQVRVDGDAKQQQLVRYGPLRIL